MYYDDVLLKSIELVSPKQFCDLLFPTRFWPKMFQQRLVWPSAHSAHVLVWLRFFRGVDGQPPRIAPQLKQDEDEAFGITKLQSQTSRGSKLLYNADEDHDKSWKRLIDSFFVLNTASYLTTGVRRTWENSSWVVGFRQESNFWMCNEYNGGMGGWIEAKIAIKIG